MSVKYVIGVDGGNTKTDYLLFSTSGSLIDYVRSGTCSHEELPGSYKDSYKEMNDKICSLLKKNKLTMGDISAGAFGLAGVDTPEQQRRLTEVVKKIRLSNFVVSNDSFLGVKADTSHGYGVCSVNGTGTVAGGIDKYGNHLQVGGIGEVLGDAVMNLLGIDDKYCFAQAVSEKYYARQLSLTDLTKAVFSAANENDKAAIEILRDVALQLAKSTAGCINNLEFDNEVEVVLAGSAASLLSSV